jgi:RimJ/RimL family protein N-acetyltransferase
MRIRHATPADAEALADVQTASWQDAYAPLLPAAFLRDAYPAISRAAWHTTLADPPPGVVLLAEDEHQVIGLISSWLRDGAAYVDSLHLRPGHRGGGIGARLLGDALACLAAMGARGAGLTIIEGNEGAMRFYARHGGTPGTPYDTTAHGVPVRYQDVTWADAAPLLRLGMQLRGPRVALRALTEADKPAIAAINADAEVMRHFPAPMSRAESDAWVDRLRAHHAAHGFGFCAVDLPDAPCIGVVGLMHIPWEAHFTPAVEIGWRIAPAHQRRGYALEAATLALRHAFAVLRLPEVVAFTVPGNTASIAVMQRLGLHAAGEFGHPRLPPPHPLHRHLLFRASPP